MKIGTLCYIKRNGKTLMAQITKPTSDHLGFWNGIGGKLEVDESPEEGAIREIREETGLIARKPILKGIITWEMEGKETWYGFIFVVTKFTGKLINDSPEGKLEWIDDGKLLDLKIHAGDKLFLKWLERDEVFSSKMIYKGEELVSHQVHFY